MNANESIHNVQNTVKSQISDIKYHFIDYIRYSFLSQFIPIFLLLDQTLVEFLILFLV